MKALSFVVFAVSNLALGSTLPGALSQSEVHRIVEIVGFGSAVRILRSSEAYDPFPGIKFGMEVGVAPSAELETFGDRKGGAPNLLMVPRLYFAKGLFLGAELIFSFYPSTIPHTVSVYGGIAKWSFYDERESWLSAAAFVGYTRISALDNSYDGRDLELGITLSKDYVRLKPYAGLGLLFAEGTVSPALVATTDNSAGQSTLHLFVGAEINFPLNVTVQFDLMNLSPMGEFLVGLRF